MAGYLTGQAVRAVSPAMETLLDAVAWERVKPPPPGETDLPYVTHQGELAIPGLPTFHVYRLNTGQRVVDEHDIARLIEWGTL